MAKSGKMTPGVFVAVVDASCSEDPGSDLAFVFFLAMMV